MDTNILRSILGVFLLLGIAYLASSNRKSINWRTIIGALALQISLGAFVLYMPAGKDILLGVTNGVSSVIGYANAGIIFIFGEQIGQKSLGFMFAFHVLPVIVFFSSLIAVLYYIGVMEVVIKLIGGGLQKLLKTSQAESMSATANIFVGQTEAPLVVKPFLPKMTRSELFAVMVGGLASVAGSVVAGYAGIGIDLKYLIAASFMAAPGGLLMAKMLVPETEQPNDDLANLKTDAKEAVNVIDAAATGASNGMMLALNVGAMLLAFVALLAMVNGLLGGFGELFGFENLSLQLILGYVFQPVAYLIGIPWHEANMAGSFLGQKIVINEFVAYLDFITVADQLSTRTQAIITFALCGFANISSVAILLGGMGNMAPCRRHDIAKLGMKAVLAGAMANLMSATIAGIFI
ncbi:NupC/NupG family nucleoside CNT transporter [Colwellia sp. 12G3]|uniref:NupC/NupG family nucleoside CNT transporter n=1 Tax=Colwellia sp. 12G3 TaxID=2058299 RepID=UPI000C34855A|nr:NupC/NupG family nucleoside CNT transporter [Colwellia sp. 12G3]PKI17607.1 NupC/NupG family nucleoside CNT transporter [Colwellia sp. 12G3]